jgi:uncharacterized protein
MKKIFLDEDTLIQDSFRLGVKIFESGFRPTFIVGLWRGGSAVGIYVQECLQTLGIETDHISVRTSYSGVASYQSIVNDPETIRIHGTQYLIENLNVNDSLLIVDDVFSTGHSIEATIERLRKKLKKNLPTDIRIATLYRRINYQRTELELNYFLHETDSWLVFPYEIKGLTAKEIEIYKPYLQNVIS